MVMIYEAGTVVLKVEVGTTLEVMKLLYEAEQSHPSDKIIGVRPRQSSGLPCIITLQDSKLEENAYDVILKDQKLPKSAMIQKLESCSSEKLGQQGTTRCLDCSRESWKSKRYISVGMNTEISINPSSQVDSLRSHLIPVSSAKQQPSTEVSYHIRQRGRPTLQRPVALGPGVYNSLSKNDYVLTTLPSLPVVTNGEYLDYRSRSPRSSPILSNGHTKICYPPHSKRIDLDSIPYDTVHSMHRLTRTPSPSIKREEERVDYNHTRKHEHYPHYEQPIPESHSDVEPPVFVLPNDFDSKHDRIDDHINYHVPKPTENEPKTFVEESLEDRSSNGSESGKSASDELAHQQSIVRKLSCKICQKIFPTKSTLYKHLRGHPSDEKPFKCNECGQGFTLSSNLRQHRIIHRGYKPFQCEYCGKKFMRSNVYKQHRRIHTGEQMHKCALCPSEFLQRYALVKHMKKTHNIDSLEA